MKMPAMGMNDDTKVSSEKNSTPGIWVYFNKQKARERQRGTERDRQRRSTPRWQTTPGINFMYKTIRMIALCNLMSSEWVGGQDCMHVYTYVCMYVCK